MQKRNQLIQGASSASTTKHFGSNGEPSELWTLKPTEDEAEAVVLDPHNSERQYYRDPTTGILREIWRPGDGDGDSCTDYHDRGGPPLPFEKRWRFYQIQTGHGPITLKMNPPPKYVVLDDRAAYEVLKSDFPRAHIVQCWSHDFAGTGQVRSRRPHRGRPAIKDPSAEGDARYHTGPTGNKKNPDAYYFKGEDGYKPVFYLSAVPRAAGSPESAKKHKASSPSAEEPANRKRRAHNQYTREEDMVKHGAPSQSKSQHRYRARINSFLRRSPSPPWSKDRSKLYGGIAENAKAFMTGMASQGMMSNSYSEATVKETTPEESLWVEQDNQMPFDDVAMAEQDDITEETHPHEKASQQLSHLESVAASQHSLVSATNEGGMNSGMYASKLEDELASAKQTIEDQQKEAKRLKVVSGQAQERFITLEWEVAALKEQLGPAKEDDDEA